MANIPPVAILKVTPDSLTLPENLVTLDASDSYDPNPNGVITNYLFIQDSAVIANSPTPVISQMISAEGIYSLKVQCTDRGGLIGVDAKNYTVNPATTPDVVTKWGAIIADGSPDDKITIINKFGGTCERHSVELINYDGNDNFFEKAATAGIKSIVNLNWRTVMGNGGNPNIYVQPNEYTAYKNAITKYLTKYKPEVVVIENEPTTDLFFKGKIDPYIAQLAYAVPIVHSFGVKVTDGGIHTPFIEQVIAANGKTLTGNAGDVQKLIEAFITIPTDYVNVHTNSGGSSVPINFISKSTDYLRAVCKKEVMSNEWHLAQPDNGNVPISLMTTFIAAWKAAKPAYCLIYSSHSDKNAPINTGTNLTAIGIEYRDRIA